MLDQLVFKNGASPDSPPLELNVTGVTLLVGPNNSGKSVALNEIFGLINDPQHVNSFVRKVVDRVTLTPFSDIEIEQVIARCVTPFVDYPRPAHTPLNQRMFRAGTGEAWIDPAEIPGLLSQPTHNPHRFAEVYARQHMVKLDGAERLGLVQGGPAGNLQGPPQSPLQVMWRNAEKRKRWRMAVHRAFGFYPAIDMTNVGQLSVRCASTEPTEEDERTVLDTALAFHLRARPIEELSDGVKAFTGILLQVMAGEAEVVFIDEPEAFLHPDLAFILGREISEYLSEASGRKRQLIVSTHSPNFMMGCVQSKAAVNVVRLTYDGSVGTARLLSAPDLTRLMRRPLLRSANALQAVFFKSAIVGEADADRAFYQEINERLIALRQNRGIGGTVFLNANGKDAVTELVKPLRRLGIPCAAIVDMDVLKQGGANWRKFMDACNVPREARPAFETARLHAHNYLSAKANDYQVGGLNLVTGAEKEAVENLIGNLRAYGLFVVPVGEVEFWLTALDIPRSHAWLHQIFERLGEDPSAAGYVRPTAGDVWEFVGVISEWLGDPTRRGMVDYTELVEVPGN